MASLFTSADAYDKSAIMRRALSQCFTYRTTAVQVGLPALNLEFRSVRVFDRTKLSVALKGAQAHRPPAAARLPRRPVWRTRRAAGPNAATRARHAAEIEQVRTEMAYLVSTRNEVTALPLAA